MLWLYLTLNLHLCALSTKEWTFLKFYTLLASILFSENISDM